MLILLLIVFIAAFILGTLFIRNEDGRIVSQVASCLCAGITFTVLICVTVPLVQTSTVDEMIEMYTEENKNIENQIELVVDKYMEFENETFTGLKSESFITLVSLYPELKSDELVKKQIELYQNNNYKLKELKKQKINTRIYRWWIYFGK